MKKIKVIILALSLLIAFTACKRSVSKISDAMQLMQVDRDFSLYSVKNGMKKAFLDYADSSVVLLRPNNFPIEGKTALRDVVKNIPDSLFTLRWEPHRAAISSSGDMGFTYGIYHRMPTDTLNGKKEENGSYVTIWKKQSDGGWKYAFDAGNEGLGK